MLQLLNLLPTIVQQVRCHQSATDSPAGVTPDGVCSTADAAAAISGPLVNDQGSWAFSGGPEADRDTAVRGTPGTSRNLRVGVNVESLSLAPTALQKNCP